MHCTWTTGPDAGRSTTLPAGRHLVGRAATAAVRCDDPRLEAHHVALEVLGDGTVWATQLTGRVPVRTGDGAPLRGRTALTGDCTLEIGASTLRLIEGAASVPESVAAGASTAATVRADGTVVRAPRAVTSWTPRDLTPPEAPGDEQHMVGGLLPAALGLGGAGVIALVLHQPMFLLFGALGSVVAVGSWVAQRVAARRARRRRAAEHTAAVTAYHRAVDDDRDAFVRAHLATVPTVATARHTIAGRSANLWARRHSHADAFCVSVGEGAVAWREGALDAIGGLPIGTDLGPGARLAIAGRDAAAVAFATIVQLAAQCGPADLRMVVVTEQPDGWAPVRALPHLQLPDGNAAIVDEQRLADVLEQLDGDERAHLLLVTDHAAALATRTGPLRRALTHDQGALLAVLADGDGVPHLCTAVLSLSNGPTARWVADTTASLLPEPVRVVGLGAAATAGLCGALASLRDPEDVLAAARLPRTVDLTTLVAPHGWSADDVLARWREPHGPLRTAIGMAGDGIVDIDMDRDGPHALLAGTTGAGKSELLRSLVLGFALAVPPEELQLVLVDYKGGATFDELVGLPHVAGVVTDLDDALADRALRSLHAELKRRESTLREHGAADLPSLRRRAPQVAMPRLVVVVDEFAALVAEQPDFLHSLVGVAQRGRSLGVHLLLATQRPQGVISDDIRANTNLRIALRLHDAADAVDVVGDAAPARLPRGVPGRAVLRLGADEHLLFQTAYLADAPAAVQAVCAAGAGRDQRPTWPAPWTPPLPTTLTPEDLDVQPGVIGLCDDPDHQRRVALHWTPAAGSVVVAGSPGSGVTSTLRTLVARALDEPHTHVHVLTAARDGADLAAHPRLVTVALHETERVHRLLHRLRMPDLDGAHRVVVIDGLEVVRRTLDQPESLDTFDALDEVLASAHDTLLVGTAQPSTLPVTLLARCAHRWVLHLHDAHDAMALGVPARLVPPAVPGRVHVASTGLTAQLLHPAHVTVRDDVAVSDRPQVDPVAVVPPVVHAAALGAGRHEHGELLLPMGLDFATGLPHHLVVPDGDHVLVLGGSRTGRSTLLARLATAWRQAHPDGRVVAVLPRRSAFPAALADAVTAGDEVARHLGTWNGRLLVVCDDAELVDDGDGALSALAASRRDGVTIVAAGRPDALRQRYGHWTASVRHARLGTLAAGGGDTDADLLATVVPRRLPVRPRPGLVWAVDQRGHRLVQTAVDEPGVHDAPNVQMATNGAR